MVIESVCVTLTLVKWRSAFQGEYDIALWEEESH